MVPNLQLKKYVLELAREKLGSKVKDVVIQDDRDSEGRPSLRITIILRARWSAALPGSVLAEISLSVIDYLSKQNDDRYPYTHYMTAREFAAST